MRRITQEEIGELIRRNSNIYRKNRKPINKLIFMSKEAQEEYFNDPANSDRKKKAEGFRSGTNPKEFEPLTTVQKNKRSRTRYTHRRWHAIRRSCKTSTW